MLGIQSARLLLVRPLLNMWRKKLRRCVGAVLSRYGGLRVVSRLRIASLKRLAISSRRRISGVGQEEEAERFGPALVPFDERRPVLHRIMFTEDGGKTHDLIRLTLPLSDDGVTVNMLVLCSVFSRDLRYLRDRLRAVNPG